MRLTLLRRERLGLIPDEMKVVDLRQLNSIPWKTSTISAVALAPDNLQYGHSGSSRSPVGFERQQEPQRSGLWTALQGVVRPAVSWLAIGMLTSNGISGAAPLDATRLSELDTAILHAIEQKKLPGGVLWLAHGGESYHKAYGNRVVEPGLEEMTEDTIFDAASLTKVIATTPSIMILKERRLLDLDSPVSKYIPEFSGQGRETVTITHLLTHTSGLRPDLSLKPDWSGYDKAISLACEENLLSAPGTVFRYSDINFILLGEVVRRVSGVPLNEFAKRNVFEPLEMNDTEFLPLRKKLDRIAPTDRDEDGNFLRGVVHDPTARRMGGVAGHAGLFFTAADLARFGRMLLNGGEVDGRRILKPETVQQMTSVQTLDSVPARRGLGWDIDSGFSRPRGDLFPLGSYGHTGWTGTSIWVDPFSKTFVIFLSNRNHPNESGNVIDLRGVIGTLAAQAVQGFDFAHVKGALAPRPAIETETAPARGRAGNRLRANGKTNALNVLNGIDVLEREGFKRLKGLKIGLITNHTGQDRKRRSTIDLLHNADGVELVALFSPEHGIRGVMDSRIGDSRDEKTGLPIYSLYGETRKPTPEQLEGLDALVFDIQDIGCRFYTYVSTMGLAMEAAAENGKRFIVLDRVNPINGVTIDGPVLNEETSFVGFHPIPLRHAMTVGELARMFNAEKSINADLEVAKLEGWRREMWFDETGLPWTNPSPNMRSLAQATLYPGIGLLESALSVGRGTDTPFEVIGAPYIDDVQLGAEMNGLGLPGIRFVPVGFTPSASVHKGEECGGLNILVTDREACPVVDVGLALAQTLYRLYPAEFSSQIEKMDRLLLHRRTLDQLKTGVALEDIRAGWRIDLDEFKLRRERYLLY